MIAWKKVDLPTLAKPTIPDFKLLPGLPSKIGFSTGPFFFGAILAKDENTQTFHFSAIFFSQPTSCESI